VKLFGRKRLQIKKGELKTAISWSRLSMLDLLLLVMVPMSITYGIASASGAEEIFDSRVIPMNLLATVIFWSIVLLLTLHLIFNRANRLEISAEGVHYKNGRFPAITHSFTMRTISNVEVKEKEDNFAESPTGQDLTTHPLYINCTSGKRIRIKGLSQDDALLIRDLVIDYRAN
jgi:hypothetical protein